MRPTLVIGTACPANTSGADMSGSSSPLSSPPPSSVIDAAFYYDDFGGPSSPVLASPISALPSAHTKSAADPASQPAGGSNPNQNHTASLSGGSSAPSEPPLIAESVEKDEYIDGPAAQFGTHSGMAPRKNTRKRGSKTPAPRRRTPGRKTPAEKEPTTPTITVTRSGRQSARKRSASVIEEKTPTKASPSAAAVAKRLKREAAKWRTESVLTSNKSPLINVGIRDLLFDARAWSVLTQDEKNEILALFPGEQHILDPGTDQARPNIPSLQNDDNFRHDCAQYQNNLREGFHDKQWLEEAYEAHEMRKAGVFDEYVIEEFESSWGVELPDEYKPSSMRATPAKTGTANGNTEGEQQEQTDANGLAESKDNDPTPKVEEAEALFNREGPSDESKAKTESSKDLAQAPDQSQEANGRRDQDAKDSNSTKIGNGKPSVTDSQEAGNGKAGLDDAEERRAKKRRKTPGRGVRTRSASAAPQGEK